MKHSKKNLDFEINLIPFIDLLSVCICFLLITAVWLNVGSMDVKQAVGGQAQEDTKKSPMMWVRFGQKGNVDLEVQQSTAVPAAMRKIRIEGTTDQVNYEGLVAAVAKLKQVEPGLNTALIQPTGVTVYEEIIDVMDSLRKSGLNDLGVSPL